MPDVVFSCGAVIAHDNFIVYYGGADMVVGVAHIKTSKLFDKILAEKMLKKY